MSNFNNIPPYTLAVFNLSLHETNRNHFFHEVQWKTTVVDLLFVSSYLFALWITSFLSLNLLVIFYICLQFGLGLIFFWVWLWFSFLLVFWQFSCGYFFSFSDFSSNNTLHYSIYWVVFTHVSVLKFMLLWHCMLIRIKSLTWLAYGADWVHWPSIINNFDRSSSWDSALKGRGIWNA